MKRLALFVLALLVLGACAPPPPPAPTDLHHNPFLVCTRLHETPGNRVYPYDDGYTYNTGNGYYGAYQFNLTTWRGAAARAGEPVWAWYFPHQAPVDVQDRVAWQLYRERGSQPWGGRCD